MTDRRCTTCGATVPDRARYCTQCGAVAPAEAEVTDRADGAAGPAPADPDATRTFAPQGGTPSPPVDLEATRTFVAADRPPPVERDEPTVAFEPTVRIRPDPVPGLTSAAPPGPPSPTGAPVAWAPVAWPPPVPPSAPPAGYPTNLAPPYAAQGPAMPAWTPDGRMAMAGPPSKPGDNLVGAILALLGAILLLVGAFTPWVRTRLDTFNGWTVSADAKLVVGLAVAAALVAVILIAGARSTILRLVLAALGVAAVVAAVVDILSVNRDVADNLNPAIGVGLVLVPIGGLLLLASAAVTRSART